MEQAIRPNISSQWFSAVGGGMRLELSATIDDLGHQLVTILADAKDESLWVKIYVDNKAVEIPIQVLREALEAAVDEVHSENWYETNLPTTP